ncbi:magnesium transporter [Desulfovibrio ferrophilus]|uniref:Magnesium transporter MgtE n=1 Tax=Desulfovibrio ferrophilus TaxID=241368 RepID=A0A2Z6AWX7_9BACT|nr:magnesium transporter [Desulfovibrio ferrophilus]BBD07757.1 magnesium transporter [Desulfovibrio ferrophilus]
MSKNETIAHNEQEIQRTEAHLAELEYAHPADGADVIEDLPLADQVEVVRGLDLEDAAEFLSEMEKHDRARLMRSLAPDLAADILEQMSPDDAADVLDDLDDAHKQQLLNRVESEEAAEIETLMTFDPDTAGGVMNTEITVVDQNLTADQAITLIRRAAEESEIPYYAYIVDSVETLVGVVSLRNLMLARPRKPLREMLENQQLVTTLYDTDKEDVAHLLRHYNFLAVPVVDYEGRLMGVVTHDDVMDIIHEEASEDMLGMVGAGQDETVDTPWLRSVALRLPWLIVNIANSIVAALVVYRFEGTIAQITILAVLMPMVANLAGNAGHQSLAMMIRQLAMEGWDPKRAWYAVWRESKIGVVNGLVMGLLIFIGVFLLTHQPLLAGVMAVALALDLIVGNASGAMFPIILKMLGRDPAQASSIFVTTVTDTMGFFLFLGLANMFLL